MKKNTKIKAQKYSISPFVKEWCGHCNVGHCPTRDCMPDMFVLLNGSNIVKCFKSQSTNSNRPYVRNDDCRNCPDRFVCDGDKNLGDSCLDGEEDMNERINDIVAEKRAIEGPSEWGC